jgi:hypothetical protein
MSLFPQIERAREILKGVFEEKINSYLENPQAYNSSVRDPQTLVEEDVSARNHRTAATYQLATRFSNQGIANKKPQYHMEMEAMKTFCAQKSMLALTDHTRGDNRFIQKRLEEFLIRLCIASISEYVQTRDGQIHNPERVLAIKEKLERDLQNILPTPRGTITELFEILSNFERQIARNLAQSDEQAEYNMRVLNSFVALKRVPTLLDDVLAPPELRNMIHRMSLYNGEYVPPSYNSKRRSV